MRKGRNLWWEKDEPGDGLRGVWNAERTLAVHLKQGISHVPVWHYLGGAKLKLLVPSRRSCPRCMKPVGECKGGGAWAACEESGTARGDWKEEQEKFLKNVGSSLELQQALERDLKEVEVGPEDPEMVVQMKMEAERMGEAAKTREVLVHKVAQGKVCGGLRLQYFPEGSGNRKIEKREALLTIIELCSNLSEKEEQQLGGAEVEVSRPERGRKGTVDVKIVLNQADELLRKVWSQLEESCKEEGVKRYMIEAGTDMSPVKEKPKTALQQARSSVISLLRKEEEEKKKTAEQQEQKESENKNRDEVTESAVVLKPSAGALEAQAAAEEEKSQHCEKTTTSGPKKSLALEDHATREQEEALPGTPTNREAAPLLQEAVQPTGRLETGLTETLRVKGQKWIPPQGKRRCSGNCTGCQRKCKELGQDDCQNCHNNKLKNTNSNGCCNRDACTNLKSIKVKKLKTIEDESLSGDQAELSQVNSIVHDFENKGVDKENRELEENLQKGLKRGPVNGGRPEDIKRSSQIARLNTGGGQSKLIAPRKTSLPPN